MRRESGVCIVNAKEIKDIKFQGIIVPVVNYSSEKIKVKEGYYNEDGEYSIRNIGSEEIPTGIGINTFKKVIYAQIERKGLCGFQIPDILITEELLGFIEG